MIETLNSAIASDIRSSYLKFLEQLSVIEKRNVVVNHFGLFPQDLINSIADGVEESMVSFGDQRRLIKRVFSILIEGLQNIRLHGGNDEFGRQLSFLFLAKDTTSYKIVFGNIIQIEDREILVKYLEEINGLNEIEIKKMYLEILSKSYLSKSGGAGLGFLIMRFKSENFLKYNIDNLSEGKALFTVEVLLNR